VPIGMMRVSPISSYVEVDGRNIDLVQVEVKQRGDAEGGTV
jgi:hypothetical protein